MGYTGDKEPQCKGDCIKVGQGGGGNGTVTRGPLGIWVAGKGGGKGKKVHGGLV